MKIFGFFLCFLMFITQAIHAQNSKQEYQDSLVQELTKSPVTSLHVGKAGKFSESYKTFLLLLSSANEEELYDLTLNASPTVRVYSFYALRYKRAPQRKQVKQRLLTDSNTVNYMRGCFKGNTQVYLLIKKKSTLYSRIGIKTGLTYLGRSIT